MRSLWDTLTADECQRAERYVFEKDRTHFVVARGLLRLLLGRYLRQDSLHLQRPTRSKPGRCPAKLTGILRTAIGPAKLAGQLAGRSTRAQYLASLADPLL